MPSVSGWSLLVAAFAPLASGTKLTAAGSEREHLRPGSLHAPFSGVMPPQRHHRAARRSFLEVDPAEDAGRVLYYVYTDSRFYDTRLQWVLSTWAPRVPKGDLVVIGDEPYHGNSSQIPVMSTNCPKHSHWEGACCKYAKAVRAAYEEMERDPKVNWAYFVDDDAYVRPEQLSAALARQTDPQNAGVALGNLGCATKECKFSICAGGGYAANRRAIYKAIDGSEKGLQRAEMQYCAKCERWADAAMTQTFLEKHIDLRPLDGLNGWKLQKSQFDHSIDGREPIMYHYIQSQAQMELLHRMFTGQRAPADQEGEGDEEQCVTYHGKQWCAVSPDPTDTPWVPNEHAKAMALIQMCEAEE